MNIVVDVKKTVIVVLILTALIVGGWYAGQSGALESILNLFFKDAPAEVIDPSQSPDAQVAAKAAIAFYTIDYQETQEQWAERLCNLATESGCLVTKNIFAPGVNTLAVKNKIQTTATAVPLSLAENSEIGRTWLVQVTLTNPWDGLETATQNVYVDVSFDDPSSSWRFNRILFEQETAN